ncbi:MAG: hypothetical protein PHH31_05820 [Acidaminococcaceae bacterium]|nr:hypothetical protein [Acidaminococcaceae bacterium]MDD4721961.1 hypothetical protein [Acidaminococcaceae bacterium]
MVKKIALLVTVLMIFFSSICFADNGKLLTAEEKIAEQAISCISGQTEYRALAQNFTTGLAKNLSAYKFKDLKIKVDEQMGSLSNSKLVILQKFDKADRVIYLANGSKAKTVEMTFIFDTTGRKPLLNEIAMRPLPLKPAVNKK